MRRILSILSALVLIAAPALAVDYWHGPPAGTWVRGDQGTTFEHWDFSQAGTMEPDVSNNPYGLPTAQLLPPSSWEWSAGWVCPPELNPTGFVNGWNCVNADGGTVSLTIPNTPIAAGTKYIFLQVTSSKVPTSVTVTGSGPAGPYTSGTWQTNLTQIQWPYGAPFGGRWYTYNYGLKVSPNPTSEVIQIQVPFNTVVDQIVVDTICSTAPVVAEPQTWSGIKALFD
jgi:hypothetical protein